jgi:hypothetical protein
MLPGTVLITRFHISASFLDFKYWLLPTTRFWKISDAVFAIRQLLFQTARNHRQKEQS